MRSSSQVILGCFKLMYYRVDCNMYIYVLIIFFFNWWTTVASISWLLRLDEHGVQKYLWGGDVISIVESESTFHFFRSLYTVFQSDYGSLPSHQSHRRSNVYYLLSFDNSLLKEYGVAFTVVWCVFPHYQQYWVPFIHPWPLVCLHLRNISPRSFAHFSLYLFTLLSCKDFFIILDINY